MRLRLSLVLTLLFSAASLSAATFVVPADGDMVRRVDAIVIGTPLSSHAQFDQEGMIETVTEFSVEDVLKGGLGNADRLTVHEPGGQIGDLIRHVSGTPSFEIGRRTLLFLNRTPRGTFAVADFVLGKFAFVTDVNGKSLVVREETEVVGWDVQGLPHIERRRDAQKFLAFIRAVVAGKGDIVPDYWGSRAPLQAGDESALGGDAPPVAMAVNSSAISYAMSCGGTNACRWPNLSAGVNWYNTNTEPGAPNGGVTAIQNALASWTNDCSSNIVYRYAGTNGGATGGLDRADGVNAVIFEQSLAHYGASPYVCGRGGTIAVGGVTSAYGNHNHPTTGEVFVNSLEADVVGNQGLANCTSFLGSGDFVTAMAHELGHTLGFRHSNQDRNNGPCPANYDCSTQAVMNSSVLSGLNAQLQQWDINAATVYYPGGSCSAPPPPPPPPPTNPTPTPPPPTGRKSPHDFDGDGRSDLLWRSGSQNAVWLMNGSAIWHSGNISQLASGWTVGGTADFNGDGKSDILWRNQSSGETAMWFMNGVSIASSAFIPSAPPQWRIEGVGDFNADNRADILWRNTQTNETVVWLMSGASLATSASIAIPASFWTIGGVGDFNGDGRADILWRNTQTSEAVVWLMNGATIGSTAYIASPSAQWVPLGVADFNADGRADIAWRNSSTSETVVWLMNGTALLSAGYTTAQAPSLWEVQSIGDFDGDGRADFFWRNTQTGDNVIWFMSGATVIRGENTLKLADLSWRVVSRY